MKMTNAAIRRLPSRKRAEFRDDNLPGLFLTVLPSGVRTWSARYRFQGRDKRFVIGKWPKVDIITARRVAGDVFRKAASGVDPQAEKIVQRRRAQAGLDKPQTFGAVWDRYLAEYVRPNLKPSTAAEMERLAKSRILPKLARQELKTIEPRQLKALIPATITGNRVHATLRQFFNWSRNELLIPASPMEGIKRPVAERSRDRVLPDIEIKIFWKGCDRIGYPFGPLFQICLLTAARRGEVGGMTIDELNLAKGIWTIPGRRTKNKREHEVTITPQFKKILNRLPSHDEFVFGKRGPPSGWSKGKKRLDREMKKIAGEEFERFEPFRIHDLRRTAITKMAELGIGLPVIERVANHISGSFGGIAGIYQRAEFKSEMAQAWKTWSDHVAKIVGNI
jgi:integrase